MFSKPLKIETIDVAQQVKPPLIYLGTKARENGQNALTLSPMCETQTEN